MTIVLLPDTLDGEPALPADVQAVRYDARQPLPATAADAQVLVVWGSSRSWLADAAGRLPGLRWVQSLAAGPDDVLAAGFGPDVLAYEPEIDAGHRLVLRANGDIVEMKSADLREAKP